MALSLRVDSSRLPLSSTTIFSGGILWRRGRDGEPEVCLAHAGKGWAIPLGPVHEDERLEDAASRHVQHRTGCVGRMQRKLERVPLGDDYAYFFLLRAAGDRAPAPACEWIPLPAAIRLVASEGERRALATALGTLSAPRARATA